MSLANTTQLETLEYRFEQMRLAFQQLTLSVAGLQSALANQQQGGFPSGGGGGVIYSMVGVVITAGGSVTGATVNALVGGSATALPGIYTVYNQMQAATVATKTIMLGQNPDGTFSAISQSC
jgi:hypothetical protein